MDQKPEETPRERQQMGEDRYRPMKRGEMEADFAAEDAVRPPLPFPTLKELIAQSVDRIPRSAKSGEVPNG